MGWPPHPKGSVLVALFGDYFTQRSLTFEFQRSPLQMQWHTRCLCYRNMSARNPSKGGLKKKTHNNLTHCFPHRHLPLHTAACQKQAQATQIARPCACLPSPQTRNHNTHGAMLPIMTTSVATQTVATEAQTIAVMVTTPTLFRPSQTQAPAPHRLLLWWRAQRALLV